MVHCGGVCGDSCRLECHDVNDCSSACGDNCTIDCHNTVLVRRLLRRELPVHVRKRRPLRRAGRAGKHDHLQQRHDLRGRMPRRVPSLVQRHQSLRADLPRAAGHRSRARTASWRVDHAEAGRARNRARRGGASSRRGWRARRMRSSATGASRSGTPSRSSPTSCSGRPRPVPATARARASASAPASSSPPRGSSAASTTRRRSAFGLDLGHYYGSLALQRLSRSVPALRARPQRHVHLHRGHVERRHVQLPLRPGRPAVELLVHRSPVGLRRAGGQPLLPRQPRVRGGSRLLRRGPPSRRRSHHHHRPYRLPDDRHRRLVHDVSSSPASSAGSGFENRNPCPRRQPSARRASACAARLDALGDHLHAEVLRQRHDRLTIAVAGARRPSG